MFEPFSRGYYLGRLYVEPGNGARAAMCRDQLVALDRQLHDASDPTTDGTGGPLVMRVGQRHYRVHGADTVAEGCLEIPRAQTELEDPAPRPVLLAKAGRATQLAALTGADEREGAGQPRDPFVPDALRGPSRPGPS